MKKAFLLFSFSLFVTFIFAQNDKETKLKTIYNQGFNNDKSTDDFEFSNEGKWLISKMGKPGKSLKCSGKGDYTSAHEGPSIIAVLKNYVVSSFELEMTIQQNGKNFDLLDFCIFFGIKDKEHYCYAQIAGHADKKTHNIFKVDGSKPEVTGQSLNKGVLWGINEWHNVKVIRDADEKTVKVYFDDELILESSDESFEPGFIGFGSTSSALKVDNIKLSTTEFTENTTSIFK
ncbi:hypothetical protein [Carboxylicivirga caseinilyticus]|uniref:hypothetical protein n=1 Tax=Carboxylicivirga caseinilyticus TaxID=3417572 RepID=UPI003D339372|nr:hypothetical protein [Marinilabiliaceae bacterium A049]